MPAKPRPENLAAQAKFVFQGTVTKLKATTLPGVPATDHTVIVRVDQVVHAPDALVDLAGHEITVQLARGERVKPNQSVVFFTNGWIFGESVAVQSIGHEAATVPLVA